MRLCKGLWENHFVNQSGNGRGERRIIIIVLKLVCPYFYQADFFTKINENPPYNRTFTADIQAWDYKLKHKQ